MNNLVEISKDKQVVTTSVRVAEVFGKQHYNVLKAVNHLIGEMRTYGDFTHLKNEVSSRVKNDVAKFAVANYKDEQGKLRKQYIMNRDGFTLLAMGFTGSKALKFKLQYIQAFNEMEAKLRKIYPCGMDSRVKPGNDVKGRELMDDKPVEVVAHTRSLPSGKKEIVLSEKAKAEIGGIVKNCLAAALEAKRPEMSGSSPNMTIEKASPNMTIEKSSPNMTKGILGSSPRMTEEISPRMTTEIDYQKLAAGVGGWVSMTLMSARYDDLKREAENLRRQAELCEKLAAETWKSVKKIESAFGI